MALLEKEAIRFAESLDDYEHVSVTDIGGDGPIGWWFTTNASTCPTRSRPPATTETSSARWSTIASVSRSSRTRTWRDESRLRSIPSGWDLDGGGRGWVA